MINLISSMLTNLGILKKINDVISGVNEHIDNKNNPHQVTAEQLGLAAAYTYQGDVDNFASLPTQGVQKGWVYNVKTEFILNNEKYPAGTDVAWDGSKWNTLGGSLKGYIRKVNNIAPDSDSNVNIKSLIPTTIQTATDLNNIKVEGRYQCDTDSVAATLLNAPLRTAFYLDVYVNSSSQVKQVVTSSYVTPQVYIRTLVNNTWGNWRTVQFTTTVYNMTEIQNTANEPIRLTGSFSHKYHEIAGGNIDLRANVDVYWVTPATSDVGVTINLSNLIKQEGYSRFITLYVDGSKCPNLRTITYTNKPSGFTLMNEPEKMMGGMVNVIGIEIVGTGNIYTITNNGSGTGNDNITYTEFLDVSDFRHKQTAYNLGDKVECMFNHELFLECTKAGTTANTPLDTRNAKHGQVLTDGGVQWTVRTHIKSVNGVVAGADGDVTIEIPEPDLSKYVPVTDVGNAANKIPKYNASGRLVLPNGAEFWIA